MRPIARSLFSLAATAIFPAGASAGEIEAASKIDAVTVYPDAAIVTRVAEVDLSQGDNVLVFNGLPLALDPASLRVEGAADAALIDRRGGNARRPGRRQGARRRARRQDRLASRRARGPANDHRRPASQARDDPAFFAERTGKALARRQAAGRRRLARRLGRRRSGARQGRRRSAPRARQGARARRRDQGAGGRAPEAAASQAAKRTASVALTAAEGAARFALALLSRRRRRLGSRLRRGAEYRGRGEQPDADAPGRDFADDRRGLERRRAHGLDRARRPRRRRRRRGERDDRLLAARGLRGRRSRAA